MIKNWKSNEIFKNMIKIEKFPKVAISKCASFLKIFKIKKQNKNKNSMLTPDFYFLMMKNIFW